MTRITCCGCRYSGFARRSAQRAGSADPADAVGEAFTKIIAATEAGRGPTQAFHADLATTVRNVVINQGRHQMHETPTILPDIAGADPDRVSTDPCVNAAYDSLPPQWREAVWMGLRDAYVNELVVESHDPSVRLYLAALAAGQSGDEALAAHAHLGGCEECADLRRQLLAVLHSSEKSSKSVFGVLSAGRWGRRCRPGRGRPDGWDDSSLTGAMSRLPVSRLPVSRSPVSRSPRGAP